MVAKRLGRCSIGPFTLDTDAELLLHGSQPLPVGRRAVAVLRPLVEHAGELVTKDELMAAAWNGLSVEEGNLTVQIAALRRVFSREAGGSAWIETLPRRGYRFVGPFIWNDQSASPAPRVPATTEHRAPSLAVLPFHTANPDEVPQYLAEGLAEDTVSMLAGLAEVAVISVGSTLRFRNTEQDLGAIGACLGARYLVRGSVRKHGSRLRIFAEQAEAASGTVLWSRSYDVQLDTVFDALDGIVANIVQALVPRVRNEELRRISMKRPDDMLAYELVLHARELIYRLDRDSFEQAQPLLVRATGRDPHYAAAHALMAEWYSLRLGQGWSAMPAEDGELVEQFARTAVAFDGTDARALARYGHSKALLRRDYPSALDLFARALNACPNHSGAWMWSSVTHSFLGDGAEAVRRGEKALQLSPCDQFAFQFFSALCLAHYTSGNYQEAARYGKLSLAENPRYLSNVRYTIAALTALGHVEQARVLARDAMALEPDFKVGPIVSRHPFCDETRRQLYGEHLRAAGLPE